MSNVINAASLFNDGHKSPEEALRTALGECAENGRLSSTDKIIIFGLDDKDGNYNVNWFGANMTTAQALALITYMQNIIIEQMKRT